MVSRPSTENIEKGPVGRLEATNNTGREGHHHRLAQLGGLHVPGTHLIVLVR